MVTRGRSPKLCRVARTYSVSPDSLVDRIILDLAISDRYVGTHAQMGDVLSKRFIQGHSMGVCVAVNPDASQQNGTQRSSKVAVGNPKQDWTKRSFWSEVSNVSIAYFDKKY